MISDDERRDVARRLRECESHIDSTGWFWLSDELFGTHVLSSSEERLRRGMARLADFIEPPYPDATASYKGWRAEVYDPDSVLASPSNVAADLVRAHADGKMRHSTKEEQNEYSAMLEKMSVELHPVDRDALLALADEMQGYADAAASGDGYPYVNAGYLWEYADRIREALGVQDA